jgi:hypothetical protein
LELPIRILSFLLVLRIFDRLSLQSNWFILLFLLHLFTELQIAVRKVNIRVEVAGHPAFVEIFRIFYAPIGVEMNESEVRFTKIVLAPFTNLNIAIYVDLQKVASALQVFVPILDDHMST